MTDTYDSLDFKNELINLKINKGDYVFIHSSLKTLGDYKDNKYPNLFQMIKKSIFELIGDNGLIVVPTFNFEFAKGIDFDVQNSLSIRMGAFSEYIRKLPLAHRTSHPMHSVSLLGKNSEIISQYEGETEFSEGSTFNFLIKKKCKILFLGDSFVETFFHVAEEKANVNYRFWKKLQGNVINKNIKSNITIKYFARNLELEPEPQIDLDKLFNYLENKNTFIYSKNSKIKLMVCYSNIYVQNCLAKLRENQEYFLKNKIVRSTDLNHY